MAQIKAKTKDYDKNMADALKARVTRKEPTVENKVRAPVSGQVRGSVKGSPVKKEGKYGEGDAKIIRNNKANVSAAQLKASGMSLRAYMNAWNKTGKRPGAK